LQHRTNPEFGAAACRQRQPPNCGWYAVNTSNTAQPTSPEFDFVAIDSNPENSRRPSIKPTATLPQSTILTIGTSPEKKGGQAQYCSARWLH
jgi:hypothetical protein